MSSLISVITFNWLLSCCTKWKGGSHGFPFYCTHLSFCYIYWKIKNNFKNVNISNCSLPRLCKIYILLNVVVRFIFCCCNTMTNLYFYFQYFILYQLCDTSWFHCFPMYIAFNAEYNLDQKSVISLKNCKNILARKPAYISCISLSLHLMNHNCVANKTNWFLFLQSFS